MKQYVNKNTGSGAFAQKSRNLIKKKKVPLTRRVSPNVGREAITAYHTGVGLYRILPTDIKKNNGKGLANFVAYIK